jgi:hypothetical protein
MENRNLKIENVNRCDNCFFSSWMKNPGRAVLICKQKPDLVGRWQGVLIDANCPNFYPSGIFKEGLTAVRRIPLTRQKFAIVDAPDYYQLSQFQWHTLPGPKTFYAGRRKRGKTVMMHREIMVAKGQKVVDHIDHNGLNNRRSNLRLCTLAQNNRNKVSRNYSSSKYKGVCWHKNRKKWVATIQLNRKLYNLGYFTDEIEAAKAYDKRAVELHRQFACLNFPQKRINLPNT